MLKGFTTAPSLRRLLSVLCTRSHCPVHNEMSSGSCDVRALIYIRKETFEKKLLGLQKFEE